MARRKRARGRGSRAGGTVRVKGHARSPRGPNAGKKVVRVKGYRRKIPG